jgi:archaellum biogenesis protein FlaJ (TadC family)
MASGNEIPKDVIKDHYEVHFKNANYLLGAHAAGLVGCLTVLKDYAVTPQLKGMGTLVVLFGVGLLASIINYVALVFSRSVAVNENTYDIDANEPTTKVLMALHLIAIAIALAVLMIAIVLLIIRFARL